MAFTVDGKTVVEQADFDAALAALKADIATVTSTGGRDGAVGPEGPAGAVGPAGPAGPTGPAGKDGTDASAATPPVTMSDAQFTALLKAIGTAVPTGTGTVASGGVYSPPASQPSVPIAASGSLMGSASDTNNYPFVLPTTFTDGVETDFGDKTLAKTNRVEIFLASNPAGGVAGENTVNILINDQIVLADFTVGSLSGMGKQGDDQLVFYVPCGKTPKVTLQGTNPGGINGIWINAVTCDYVPLVVNGLYDSRGHVSVNSPNVFDTGSVADVVFGPPIAVAAGNGPIAPVSTQHALADAIAAASGTLSIPPGVYNESVGINKPLTIDGGGKVVNPGLRGATYAAVAVLDGAGVGSLVQGQGGFVPLSDGVAIKGFEVRNFGLGVAHDGTGGIRNNALGHFRAEDIFLHKNQMGIGPHMGDATFWNLKNILAIDCGLTNDQGYAHNFYMGGEVVTVEGGITSIVNPGTTQGHAFKSRAFENYFSGVNYFYSSDSSCIDLPSGTRAPFTIAAGTVIEKKTGDANRVLFGYGAEGQPNGNAGGSGQPTFIIPNDGNNYIVLTSGPVDFTGAQFLFTDGSPVPAGRIVVQTGGGQPQGTVTGLPV
jgi:hypothetical protein